MVDDRIIGTKGGLEYVYSTRRVCHGDSTGKTLGGFVPEAVWVVDDRIIGTKGLQ